MMPMFKPEMIEALKVSLTEEEFNLFQRIVATQGKNKGCLRASKPKVTDGDTLSGHAAYVWRMVAFQISTMSQHHCMPVCADFDVPRDPNEPKLALDASFQEYADAIKPYREARRALLKTLDATADKIVNVIPKSQWHGISRWSRVLGG